MNRFRLSKKNDFQTQKKFTKMGSCLSAPTDVGSVDTSVRNIDNGSDEAALIYSGNMVVSSKISLSFECKDLLITDVLSKSDPFIVVYMRSGSSDWMEIGRTEVAVNNQNPSFVKKIITNYKFEEIQRLRICVFDADTEGDSAYLDLSQQDYLGEAEVEVPTLVHNSSSVSLPLFKEGKPAGTAIVKCEEMNQSSGDIIFNLRGEEIPSDCFLRISSDSEKNGVVPLFKTEVSESGKWKEFSIDVSILCNCDYNRPLILEVFQYNRRGNHKLIGTVSSSTASLLQSSGKLFQLTGESAEGSIMVEKCVFQEKASFLQFVQQGLDINFMVCIDFTGSNGDPRYPNSLHYANPNAFMQGQFNQYEKAIYMIGNVIEFYDSDRMFPVYGFGACRFNTSTTEHCFALNNNESNPEVSGVQGIMNLYHSKLLELQFSGPTLFAPILAKAASIASVLQRQRDKYLVMLILTDGAIHDMEDSIRQIVHSAHLPLSILIVGVGDDDFTSMETLDGDKHKLKSDGHTIKRDIVQFVAMRDVESFPPERIAQILLEEIPSQVTGYMKMAGITPSTMRMN